MAARKKALKPRKQPTQARARATCEAILKATAHILARDGYEAANTNAIAARAGVSVGSLYQYFPGKDAVIAALVEEYMQSQRAIVASRVARLGAESRLADLAHELVGALFESRSRQPTLHKAIVEQIPRTGHLGELIDLHRSLSDLIMVALARHRRGIDAPRPELAVFFLVHAVDAMVNAAIFGAAPANLSERGAVSEISRLVCRALGL